MPHSKLLLRRNQKCTFCDSLHLKTINSAFVFIAAISKTWAPFFFFVIYLAVLEIATLSALFTINYSAACTKGMATVESFEIYCMKYMAYEKER
jgi:hypothetical protein